MLAAILELAIANRVVVLIAACMLAVTGIASFERLPIDAVPDITNVQVQVNTAARAHTTLDVERQVTFPIESAMTGIPGVEGVRSLSRYGLSQVTVVFEDGTDIYFARQLVSEKIQAARDQLPAGAEPRMGPIATGLGEIFIWSIENAPGTTAPPRTLAELRGIQDWIVRPRVRTVRGVNEVNTIGGHERIHQVVPDPARLAAHDLAIPDLFEALSHDNLDTGAGYLERGDEQYMVRATGRLETADDVRAVVVAARAGVPVLVGHVADVVEGHELRTGAATRDGEETVLGTALMLLGENSRTVARRTARRVEEVSRALPPGVTARTLYDRTTLVDATLETVRNNLFEGAVLVVVVLLLLLGNARAALITAAVIPLSMLFAVIGMVGARIGGNLMSLGAIDFGLIVDGAVIIVENCVRRVAEREGELGRPLTDEERTGVIRDASVQVRQATMFGEAIIMIVYLPILTLTGVEGRMFRPMAWTVLFALTGAMVLSVTFVPALCALALGASRGEHEVGAVRLARRAYVAVLDRVLEVPWLVALASAALLAATVPLALALGSEFVPRLREGALAIRGLRLPSIGMPASVALQRRLEKQLASEFPDEIDHVFSRIGTDEAATDPQGPEGTDCTVMLKPRSGWKRAGSEAQLAAQVARSLESLVGETAEVSQPIELRFNELISGVKSDLAVKVFGDRTETTLPLAHQVRQALERVPGAADVRVEPVTGLPVLSIEVDRAALARHGLRMTDVHQLVEIAVGGKAAGVLLEGDRRVPLVVRLGDDARQSIERIKALRVPLPVAASRGFVPLSALARVQVAQGPNQISHENGKRRVVVSANVRGRDLGSFVHDAHRAVDAALGRLPEGCWLEWGGQFRNLEVARARLAIVVPVALALIFMLLLASLGSARLALFVFTGVPFALTGGVAALTLRGIPFSISSGVGFIALSGVSVLNGLVIVSFIEELRRRGVPLATVVIGGLLTSTALTLVVVPSLYGWFAPRGTPP